MSCEVFPSLGQIAQKHHKKDSEQVDPKIMTTAMVIDDLDDHGFQMMTGRTKNARIRSGSTPGPLRRQGRQQGDTGTTAMAGTPPGTGGRPQGRLQGRH